MFTGFPRVLTDLIYDCMLGDGSWDDVLRKLGSSLPEGRVALFSAGLTSTKDSYIFKSSGLDAGDLDRYNAHFNVHNPLQDALANHGNRPPHGNGYGGTDNQLISREVINKLPVYNEFFRDLGMHMSSGIRLHSDRRSVLSLVCFNGWMDEGDHVKFSRALTEIGPHLLRAVNFYRALGGPTSVEEGFHSRLENRGSAHFVVGDDLRLRSASSAAMDLFAKGTLIKLVLRDIVRFISAEVNNAMTLMTRRDYQTPGTLTFFVDSSRITLIRTSNSSDTLLLAGPTIIVFVDALQDARPYVDADIFAATYCLTPAELRAAHGLIAGKSVDEIAADADVSRETIRSQIRRLYQKTDCANQADLLRVAQPLFLP